MLDSFEERAEANDHFELFTFPYADSALVLERNRVEGPPRPRGRLAAYLNDIVLENWALEALSAAGIYYLALTTAFMAVQARIEVALGKGADKQRPDRQLERTAEHA